MNGSAADWIDTLKGPIAVLGAGGFVGCNLFRHILARRRDVYAVARVLPAPRLRGIDPSHLVAVDFTDKAATANFVEAIRPATVFDCIAYGAYSFETDADLIYATNFTALVGRVERLAQGGTLAAYVHAGSSSEYGLNSAAPAEDAALVPNSAYAVSKAAAAQYLAYAGKTRRWPVVNLRLYSVYGPYEDAGRLIPAVVSRGMDGGYPDLVDPTIARDFVYVEDVCQAFVRAAAKMSLDLYGESLNIGTGIETTIGDLALTAKDLFGIAEPPRFGAMAPRAWDLARWQANPEKAERLLGWRPETSLAEGLARTAAWMREAGADLSGLTKAGATRRRSIAAIIACYKDEEAVPIMHARLTAVFRKIDVDYEIIFVNDASPDGCGERIRELSASDPHVLGITHSRNFGSQMAFRSGMELATAQACVLLDGDLQDPPELIAPFYEAWVAGHDVVYGRRVKREMPLVWGLLYKAFYRVFAAFSYVRIPHDAGDFSLMDRRVVGWLLNCPERDLFMRGLRAYVGFRQTGVDYVRPKRMFGTSTNNLLSNLEWAKRGIFSFSNTPLKMLTAAGIVLLGLAGLIGTILVAAHLLVPDIAPRGAVSTQLAILFFGALNLFAIGLIGEYVAKIMEEVKGRPRLIRAALIRGGVATDLPPEGRARP
ncbi:NAD-dependent epimerase/dehydratase family protein [Methylobacterium frigidaeris]|uniref:Undecaprenyl-phosphate 4-deoxy-4-formamido-L-arabinose transferase n=3 Tax=Methylobacterium frigidaeris TaxID=2038277 RepID=A0AA37HBX5_9HYPH|nr:NAD-dependent epimerase/dehydratase family protein [Methylobacterium frigidaeris]GJD63095.1 Undecaprenyl-phosphate 4-deoxy-4-formamido-L-arabinose transferase [Methylobacterium frigidaeris]